MDETNTHFDIAEWQRLAQQDPGEFERRRQASITAFIEQAPPEHRVRLRGLQFRIDLERRRAKTPLGAAIRLQSLMWERFGELREALMGLVNEEQPKERNAPSAKILPFTKLDPSSAD